MSDDPTRKIATEPWHAATEVALMERPGVVFVYLLTDECGCVLLARGILPDYLVRQAQDALDWNGTEARGVARRALDREARQPVEAPE